MRMFDLTVGFVPKTMLPDHPQVGKWHWHTLTKKEEGVNLQDQHKVVLRVRQLRVLGCHVTLTTVHRQAKLSQAAIEEILSKRVPPRGPLPAQVGEAIRKGTVQALKEAP